MCKDIVHKEGSDNVFADIGVRDPEGSLVRANLAKQIAELIGRKGLRQNQVADILGVDQSKVLEILPNEVRETVNLYLDGKIDQWYSLQDRRGVVFILNVTDPAVAHEMLEMLPLGQAHLMSFDLIPIGPLNPLRRLPGMTPNPQ